MTARARAAEASVTPILYAAHGGFGPTEATLRIDPSGAGRMFLGTTMSLPPAGDLDVVGAFEGKVDAKRLKRVTELLGPIPAPPAAGDPPVPGSVVRSLSYAGPEGAVEVTIPGYAPPPFDEVERLLQEVMVALVRSPAGAVRAHVDAQDGAPGLTVSVVGEQPVRVRFVADDGGVTAGGTVVVLDADGAMLATSSLDPASVAAMVAPGPVDLGAGDRLRFAVAPPAGVPRGRAVLSGGLEFELEDGGRFHRVSVQAAEAPFRR